MTSKWATEPTPTEPLECYLRDILAMAEERKIDPAEFATVLTRILIGIMVQSKWGTARFKAYQNKMETLFKLTTKELKKNADR